MTQLPLRAKFVIGCSSLIILGGLGFYFLYLSSGRALIFSGVGIFFLLLGLWQKATKDELVLTPSRLRFKPFLMPPETIPWEDLVEASDDETDLTLERLDKSDPNASPYSHCIEYDDWGRECSGNGRVVPLELAVEWIEALRNAGSDEERSALIQKWKHQEWKQPWEQTEIEPKKRQISTLFKKRRRFRILNPEKSKSRLKKLFRKLKRTNKLESKRTTDGDSLWCSCLGLAGIFIRRRKRDRLP